MATTIGNVIDRLYRDYLTPPDEQPAQTTLNGTINASVTSLIVTDDVLTLEEEESIGAGTILEMESELTRVTAVAWPTLIVQRGVLGTTAAIHTTGVPVIVRPKYPRQGVFEAICDTIEELNADLFSVATSATFTTVDTLIEVPATVQRILGVYYQDAGYETTHIRYVGGGVELLEDLPVAVSSTTKAIQLHGVPTSRVAFYTYRCGFTRPTAETYDLTTNGPNFADEWVPLLLLGALINLISGTDIPTRTQEFITQAVATQGYPVGSGESISRALVRIFEYRLGRARLVLYRKYPMRVEKSQVAWG